MDKLLHEILAKEFRIDEPCELVGHHDMLDGQSAERPENQEESCESSSSSILGDDDLIRQISQMMCEQDRLNDIAEELRSKNSKTSTHEFMDFFKKSLPVLDSLDRIVYMYEILENPSEELTNWIKSVAALRNRVTDLFGRFGLRTMDPVGKTVNLDRHEVVDIVLTDSIPEETIVEVRQKGFVFNGKILRDARVVVAKNDRS